MPKRKYIAYVCILIGFLIIGITAVIMTYPRYQKSMEQLPELISEDTPNVNAALLDIRRQLDEAGGGDGSMKVVWTGYVCASKYGTLGGSEKIYYVCPYVVAESASLTEKGPADWICSLRFAVSVLEDGTLEKLDTDIHVTDITFACRVGENALIGSAGYGDREMAEVNGKSVSYQFRDSVEIKSQTDIFVRLSVSAAPSGTLPEEETAVFNWSFKISEKNHEIGVFDDVQIDIPYLFSR